MKPLKMVICFCSVALLLSLQSCNLPTSDTGESSAEQTLMAIYVAQTVAAANAAQPVQVETPEIVEPSPTEPPTPEPTPTKEIVHVIYPGEPGYISQYWMDTNTSSMASEKRAFGGDSFSINLFERPFTSTEMVYHPDVDLVKVEISSDATFYYFNLHFSGIRSDQGKLAGHYGVELDFDRDGRGDLLLWALADGSTAWNIDNVFVYRDANNDAGGRRPMQSDAPDYTGDSYELLVFSPDHLEDPDAAWKRVSPQNPGVMQLAIKKSLLENQVTFMWNGWADDGAIDPARLDYNDAFTFAEAGSPYSGVADYPVKSLFLVDNTCRLAYGFTPTGLEIGGCILFTPTPTTPPVPTGSPAQPDPDPGCNCRDYINYTFIDTEECCVFCGYIWYGTDEFPCGLPPVEPPCDCDSFPNYTFMDTEECCTYCGHTWTGDVEFPCEN